MHTKRDVINAILYLNKTGAQWRMLASQSAQCCSIAVRPADVAPDVAIASRNLDRQWLSQSGHGFGGSGDGLDGPSMSITIAAPRAIHGP